MQPDPHFVSVAMAVRDAEAWLPDYLRRLAAELDEAFMDYELIVVDDASPADVVTRVKESIGEIPGVQLFCLSRRVDEHTAVTAALDHAIGDVVVTVDAPLDPPDVVVEAARGVAGGMDVVYGIDSRRHTRSRRLYRFFARAFTAFVRRTTGMRMPVIAPGLRAVSRRALNHWLDIRDRDRLLRVMPALSGYRYTVLDYESAGEGEQFGPRSLRRSLRSGIDAVLASTATPLRLATYLALLASFLNLVYALYVVGLNVIRGDVVEGWTTLSLQAAGMFFIFSIILAIVAEYVFQIVQRTHERPLYRISEEFSTSNSLRTNRFNVSSFDGTDVAASSEEGEVARRFTPS